MKPIQPATRIASVEEYYFSRKLAEIARMNAEAAALAAQGRPAPPQVISLGIGGTDFMPSEATV